jgi:hypothetical protein
MSGLRTVKHAAVPRHATPVPRTTVHRRILLNPLWTFARNLALVVVAVVVLLTAVLGVLAVTSWTTNRASAGASSHDF